MFRSILTTAAIVTVLSVPAFAAGDAEKGEKVFKKCKACCAVSEGAKNKVGPAPNGIVGAAAGQNEDFKYTDVLTGWPCPGETFEEASRVSFCSPHQAKRSMCKQIVFRTAPRN